MGSPDSENSLPLTTLCDFAKVRYVDIGRLRKLWGTLWFLLGVSVALFLSISILFFLRASWLAGAVGLLGTIVNGAGMTWITTQRRIAADEEEKAFSELVQHCAAPAESKRGFFPEPSDRMAVRKSDWFQELEAAKRSDDAAKRFLANLRS